MFSPLTLCPVLLLGFWPLLSISSVPVSAPPLARPGPGLYGATAARARPGCAAFAAYY